MNDALALQRQIRGCLGTGPEATSVKFKDVGDKKRLKFDKNKLLGSGSFGTRVYLGTFRHEITNRMELVAIKQVQYNTDKEYAKAYQEVDNLQKLVNDNIVRYLFADKIDDHNLMCIALELCLGSLVNVFTHEHDVFERPFRLRTDESCTNWWFKKDILRSLTVGLIYVHEQRFIHRDMKPQNVLVKKDNSWYGYKAVICDFEFTRKMLDGKSKLSVSQAAVGTQGWMPREVLEIEGQTRLTSSVDVFAYGCIVHYVLCGNREKQVIHPFGSDVKRDHHILEGTRMSYVYSNLYSPDKNDYNDWLSNCNYFGEAILADMLIGECVSSDETLRPLASEALSHPFFWTYSERINCCEKMFNTLKSARDRISKEKIISMDRMWNNILNKKYFFFHDIPVAWDYYRFHRDREGRDIPPEKITSSIFHGLMRFIRNIQQHYYDAIEDYPPLKEAIRDGDNETLGKYFFERIPMSFPVIYMFHKFDSPVIDEESIKKLEGVFELQKQTLKRISGLIN